MRLHRRRRRSLHDLDVGHAHYFREEDRNIVDLLRNDHDVPISMAANSIHRDMYQLANRVPDRLIAHFNDPAIAMNAIRNDLRRRLQAHITRNHPVERISSWEYSFDIARDAINQETRVVCTARRERIA